MNIGPWSQYTSATPAIEVFCVVCIWYRIIHPVEIFPNILILLHDDIIKWKHFLRYWPFVREFTGHKGQWRGALMFPFICAIINGWANNHGAGDLRRRGVHYDVTVMTYIQWGFTSSMICIWKPNGFPTTTVIWHVVCVHVCFLPSLDHIIRNFRKLDKDIRHTLFLSPWNHLHNYTFIKNKIAALSD